ncbi:MAG: tRNA-dihydrouridine synthase, partial [Patescibacteria group bacterium]|nr:tRNA-dihydrouridine synthase [Patescibacteria group bacterium]
AGAALIKNPSLVREIIAAAKEAAGGLPVSLKTRIGYNRDSTEEWIGLLLQTKLDALTIHGRTRSEGFGGEARWRAIRQVVLLRNKLAPETIIIGNGGIRDLLDAENKIKESGVDGAMVGRALLGNPWFFGPVAANDRKARLDAIKEHVAIFDETFGDEKNFDDLKKHFAAYASGFEGAKELRMKLMSVGSAEEARAAVAEFETKR